MSGAHRRRVSLQGVILPAIVLLVYVVIPVVFVLLFAPWRPHPNPSLPVSAPAPTSTAQLTVPSVPTVPSSTPVPAPSTSSTGPTYVYYTVVPGDNLTVIAAKFAQAGWQPIYGWNATVIGQNPNLIRPGQRIIVQVVPG